MAYQIVILKQLNEGCAAVRKAVFMEEQGFQQEFDDVDDRAYHVLIQDGERPVATGRLFTEDGETYLIGRVAVLSAYLGEHVVTALEQQAKACGAKCITLSAQCRAAGFYEKLGYTKTEEYHMDEFCPHVTMRKAF